MGKGGDFVTWEVVLGNWRPGDLVLMASVTFQELEQESSTHDWVSGGGPEVDPVIPSEATENNMVDVTLPCRPIMVSLISSLQPCPLIFFGGFTHCDSTVGRGDSESFRFLWHSMEQRERTFSFVIPSARMEGKEKNAIRSLADTQKGYVMLSSINNNHDSGKTSTAITGCAFVAPGGYRILR